MLYFIRGAFMYKIFIDTNIFLDFYRYNKNNIKIMELIKEFQKYKKHLINTEQSNDEFMRNREKTIRVFMDTLKAQINSTNEGNFISNLEGYTTYLESVKLANDSIQLMIKMCEDLIVDKDKDPVYQLYLTICHTIYERTPMILDNAIRRKYMGNPPSSDKYTCCDEIIWESILEYCYTDLIIVTRDKTFLENYSFLQMEFYRKKNKNLIIKESISDAIRVLGNAPSDELENLEDSILLEKEQIENENFLDSTWAHIVEKALQNLDGEATLNEIYESVFQIVSKDFPHKLNNHNMHSTIRGTLQRFCRESKWYGGKEDLFRNVKKGVWKIKDNSLL